jgi:hypothetical protein
MQKRADLERRRRGAMAFLIASLMISTLIEPTLGVGFGRGCEGAIVDGAGREGVAAVNSVAETPRRTVTLGYLATQTGHKVRFTSAADLPDQA